MSPNLYNTLGVGTTQLYNKHVVYNHKRHGEFTLGKRTFQFCIKPHFPKKVTKEFLLVDLVNNLENLAGDKEQVLEKVYSKKQFFDVKKLAQATKSYGVLEQKNFQENFYQQSPIQLMPSNYLQHHKNFVDLLNTLEDEKGIQAAVVEKDYWIMHVLHGLTQNGFTFELKGGTSLSKGYNIIHRFSENIDIHIQPPAEFKINPNPKNTNPKNSEARKDFYDWLASNIKIDGIIAIERDTEFDDTVHYRSGGIRLY